MLRRLDVGALELLSIHPCGKTENHSAIRSAEGAPACRRRDPEPKSRSRSRARSRARDRWYLLRSAEGARGLGVMQARPLRLPGCIAPRACPMQTRPPRSPANGSSCQSCESCLRLVRGVGAPEVCATADLHTLPFPRAPALRRLSHVTDSGLLHRLPRTLPECYTPPSLRAVSSVG